VAKGGALLHVSVLGVLSHISFVSSGGLIPLIMCFELATFLGSGLILVTGCFYGFLALGKK
jgi:hypothetical protein